MPERARLCKERERPGGDRPGAGATESKRERDLADTAEPACAQLEANGVNPSRSAPHTAAARPKHARDCKGVNAPGPAKAPTAGLGSNQLKLRMGTEAFRYEGSSTGNVISKRPAPDSSDGKPGRTRSLTSKLEPCLTLPSIGRGGSSLTDACTGGIEPECARPGTETAAPSCELLRDERGVSKCKRSETKGEVPILPTP